MGFHDWATGDLAALEADAGASHVLSLSKQLGDAAERAGFADVAAWARAIVAYVADKPRSMAVTTAQQTIGAIASRTDAAPPIQPL